MVSAKTEGLVRLDLNNPVFQANLLDLQKPERNAALDTLKKIPRLSGCFPSVNLRSFPVYAHQASISDITAGVHATFPG